MEIMKENSENNKNSQSRNVQIDVLKVNLNVNTQGQMFTTDSGGANTTTHELSCILNYLENNRFYKVTIAT